MTSVHFDEREDADAFVASIARAGVSARLHRDEFAGEDDAEDAAWIVEADVDPSRLREVAERCGGWVVDESAEHVTEPPPLPLGPRRIKNQRPGRPSADG